MNLYSYRKELKQKILSYFLKNGKKQNCESILLKTIKHIQKSNKQSHTEIIKLSVLNTTPIFKIIKLKQKKKKKKKGMKNVKEIPGFLSNRIFRLSYALKLTITTARKKKTNLTFYNQLKNEILLNAKYSSNTINLKDESQKQALQKKKFFKHYRW
jgi:ribosomal protein S7